MGDIVGNIDLSQVVLYVFWAFFFGLILYLRREDHREGYPLVTEDGPTDQGLVWTPDPKLYLLPHGGEVMKPDFKADDRPLNAQPAADWPGAPLVPTGDPMRAGVGPGSWAERTDSPDLTFEGEPKIVPLRIAPDFFLDPRDPDPRGMPVISAEGAIAGTISDVWVDRSEFIIRFLEVQLPGVAATSRTAAVEGNAAPASPSAQRVLLPFNFADLDSGRGVWTVKAIYADQFAGVPGVRTPDRITFLEEERIYAYYGGGLLYADSKRQESWL